MKKTLLRLGLLLLILIIVVITSLGHIVKKAIETAGPKIAGVPITVDTILIRPLSGIVHIKGLFIGNPEGFQTSSAMELRAFKVKIDLKSIMSDPIIIKEILIDGAEITYEKGLKSSNLSTLMDQLAAEEKEEEAEEEIAEEQGQKPSKKIIIEDFQFNKAKVHATFTAMGGKKFSFPLPSIQMTDIGKDSGGTSFTEATYEMIGAITHSVGSAAKGALKGAGKLTGDAVKGTTGLAGDALKGTGSAAKDAGGSLKKGMGKLFGK